MQATAEQRSEMFSIIEKWKQSGLTQKAYCEEHSIPYHVFHYWYKCYRDEKDATRSNSFSFVQLQVPSSSSFPAMELLLNDGKRLVFHQLISSDYLKSIID